MDVGGKARRAAAVLGVLGLSAGCGDGARVPATMWTTDQAVEAVEVIRGLPVRVRHCDGLGTARKADGRLLYRRFSCLASARASFQGYDTVAVTYVLRPLGPFAGRSSRYALSDVRFTALETP